jgi:tetratricopeptide (TPR) repeat protein
MGRKKKNKSNGTKKEEETVIITSSTSNNNNNTTEEDNNDKAALQYKEQGNAYYGTKEYPKAAEAYQAGLDSLLSSSSSILAIALRSNLAMTLLKLERFDLADMECSRILTVDPLNVKGASLLFVVVCIHPSFSLCGVGDRNMNAGCYCYCYCCY